MTELKKDINILTNIPEKALKKVSDLSMDAISTAVFEDFLGSEDITEVDIGIGILRIKHENVNDIRYQFTPNPMLSKEIEYALKNNEAPLHAKLNNSLRAKFLEVYKEIC